MHVLTIANSWPSKSWPRRIIVSRQVEGLRRAGVDVDVLVVDRDAARFAYARASLKILLLNFAQSQYDVIHAHTGHCGLLACLQIRSPVVLSYVGYDLDGPAEHFENVRTRIERVIFKRLSVMVAATIAKSARGRRALPERGRSRNSVIPNGVDRRAFVPLTRTDARSRLRWDEKTPTALFAGDPTRFTKRYELATGAVEEVRARGIAIDLAIAHPIDPTEMPLWMSAADVLLLSSVSEGSPNVVKEAMACNLPVVSVEVGDVREIVAGTRHCYICPADAGALADALVDVIRAMPERSNGRERSRHLAIEEISLRIIGVYDRASLRGPGLFGFCPRRRRAASS